MEDIDLKNVQLDLDDVAVVGMNGRFPGANNLEEFWDNIKSGKESIMPLTDEQLYTAGVKEELFKNEKYVKMAGCLQGIELFDADFFGYSGKDAELMDPQHRIFLECSWHALENANIKLDNNAQRIGVFAGSGFNTYLLRYWNELRASGQSFSSLASILHHNSQDYFCTKVSYKLNLNGPSVTVQTACSTSLVAVHFAVQSLVSYESDIALAGGASVLVPNTIGYMPEPGGIFSQDGHCRAFDRKASGTVFGSGVGVVVLKRLSDAIQHKDHIYAVIKGSAVNNDGSLKVGFTAPNIDGQAAVISDALAIAEIDPVTISYIEAHGTGTALGDPIEIAALSQVFRTYTQKKQYCAIGSVKTNVGHLNAAAGITGLIKTVLCLQRDTLPPSLHFKEGNPEIDFGNSPFYVNVKCKDWKPKSKYPLRAGVSSFGIGGTNAHIILEKACEINSSETTKPYHILLLSAKTNNSLNKYISCLAQYLVNTKEDIADIAYTLQNGRYFFDIRFIVICCSKEDAIKQLLNHKNIRAINVQSSDDIYYQFLKEKGMGWVNGDEVDWGNIYFDEERKFVSLPNYCFESKYYWLHQNSNNQSNEIHAKQFNTKLYSRPKVFSTFKPPSSSIEHSLVRLWIEILKIKQVGVFDDFYSLGGDSLLATQMLSRLENMFPLEFNMEVIKNYPNISLLADYIEKGLETRLSELSEDEVDEILKKYSETNLNE